MLSTAYGLQHEEQLRPVRRLIRDADKFLKNLNLDVARSQLLLLALLSHPQTIMF